MQQNTFKNVAVYEAPVAETIILAANACLCESRKANGLDTLPGEEW